MLQKVLKFANYAVAVLVLKIMHSCSNYAKNYASTIRQCLPLTLERPRGVIGFSDLKFEAFKNQNETFSTCSLIMSASCDVNWMMSSLIKYA